MTEHLSVNRDLCDGYANCVFVAPGIFELDDENRVIAQRDTIDDADLEEVQLAAAECPTRAINLAHAT